MNCIVVENDKIARLTIKELISSIDFLKLKEECSNSTEAFEYLNKEPIDLLFLDVEMPGMTGIELIKNLVKRPIIILITAKKDHAVEAYEHNVADYIIKPLGKDRFSKAVGRAKELFEIKQHMIDIDEKYKDYIFVRCNSLLTKIKLYDIIDIKASGDYVNINTTKNCYMVHSTLKSMEEKLPPDKFCRLNHSCLVSMDHPDSIENNASHSIKFISPSTPFPSYKGVF